MHKISIRKENPEDVNAIDAVIVSAFLHAPHTDHTEQFIVKALRKARVLSISLVAEVDRQVIGHVAVSPVTISDGSADWYGLGPISVIPEFQRRGIGSLLMRSVIEELQIRGVSGCVVLGDPPYYGRFGFKQELNLILPGFPPEYFQVLLFGKHLPQGQVIYHEAFNTRR